MNGAGRNARDTEDDRQRNLQRGANTPSRRPVQSRIESAKQSEAAWRRQGKRAGQNCCGLGPTRIRRERRDEKRR